MTPKERIIAALNLQIPDEVPTFELEFQLDEEMFGKSFTNPKLNAENRKLLSEKEIYNQIYETACFIGQCYEKLGYGIIPANCSNLPLYDGDKISDYMKFFFKTLKEVTKNERLLGFHADGTFAIPDGDTMYDFVYRIADDPDGLKKDAELMANNAIEHNKKMHEAGIDVGLFCSDYCYNSGPFLSPEMCSEFITPYLYQ
jgi:uroporphyrinogen decarboxylase